MRTKCDEYYFGKDCSIVKTSILEHGEKLSEEVYEGNIDLLKTAVLNVKKTIKDMQIPSTSKPTILSGSGINGADWGLTIAPNFNGRDETHAKIDLYKIKFICNDDSCIEMANKVIKDVKHVLYS